MIQPSRSRRRRQPSLASPRVQSDVVMATARREKRAAAVVLLRQLEAEHVPLEAHRPFEVGDFQVDVSDAHVRVDWLGHPLPRDTRTRSGTEPSLSISEFSRSAAV